MAQANTEESFKDKRDSIVDGKLTPHHVGAPCVERSLAKQTDRGKKSLVSRSISVSLLLDRFDVLSSPRLSRTSRKQRRRRSIYLSSKLDETSPSPSTPPTCQPAIENVRRSPVVAEITLIAIHTRRFSSIWSSSIGSHNTLEQSPIIVRCNTVATINSPRSRIRSPSRGTRILSPFRHSLLSSHTEPRGFRDASLPDWSSTPTN